jgi:uncharacterized membrane protein YuzA (DUF378 family)
MIAGVFVFRVVAAVVGAKIAPLSWSHISLCGIQTLFEILFVFDRLFSKLVIFDFIPYLGSTPVNRGE